MEEVTNTSFYNSYIKNSYAFEDTILLNSNIQYYYFFSNIYKKSIEKINKYTDYLVQQENLKYMNEKCIALNNYFYQKENNYPYNTYELSSKSYITLNQNCLLCLYSDYYSYYGGAHGMTVRKSYNFNLKLGEKLKLYNIVKINPKKYITTKILQEINNNPIKYEGFFDLKWIKEYFNPESFYLTETGLTIYYGLYEIAPYAMGIVTFNFPYDEYIVKPNCND